MRYQTEKDVNDNRVVVCDVCGFSRSTHWQLHQIHHVCRVIPLAGDCLFVILRALGVPRRAGCGCDEMIAKMNAWGPAGCRENRTEILEHLEKAYDKSTWAERAKAGLLALVKGYPKTLDGILELAIERVESRSQLTIREIAELRVKWQETTIAKLADGPVPIDQLGYDYDQYWLSNLLQSGQIAKITISGQTLYGLPANYDITS